MVFRIISLIINYIISLARIERIQELLINQALWKINTKLPLQR